MRLLILTLHRPMRSPSQRFRFEQYIEHWEAAGHQVEHSFLLDAKDDRLFYQANTWWSKGRIAIQSILKRYLESRRFNDYDFIYVQREAIMLGTAFFERLAAKSKARLIFDFDDSIWMDNVSASNKHLAFLKSAAKTNEIIALADTVVAGNAYLEAHAKQFNSNTQIIPTTIDTTLYQFKAAEAKERICIGWSGSVTTIQHFRTVLPALREIHEALGDKICFQVIGDGNYQVEALNIQGIPWKAATELDDLYQIDIGLMPLPDDRWAAGKCGLKGLQYMALGIPTIMSPVGVNTEIIQHGENGFLAAEQSDWVDCIKALVLDFELRKTIGAAGRRTVEQFYSVEANKAAYLALLH